MLFSSSEDPGTECGGLVERYRSCMRGFGFGSWGGEEGRGRGGMETEMAPARGAEDGVSSGVVS